MDIPIFLLKASIYLGVFFILFVVLSVLLVLFGFVTPALIWYQILFG